MSASTESRPAPKARDVAFAVIRDVFGPPQRGAVESLDYHLGKTPLDARDRAFATELAYGTIEMRRWLDFQLDPYLRARAAALPAMIGEILRMGTYQLRAMRVHPYAAVSESVTLARKFGHAGTAGLVNAVLRRVSSEAERSVDEAAFASADDALGTRWSLPTWIVRSWRERFGSARLEPILRGVNEPARVGLTIDLRRATRAQIAAELAGAGRAAEPSPFAYDALVLDATVPSETLIPLLAGRAQLQSEAASFPVDLLDPRPGMRILEAGSGRGNKTLQIVARTGERSPIVALDADPRKVARARARLDAAGAAAVELRCADLRALDAAERFDAVLLDAPCSGIGIVGRQPELRWRKGPDDGARLAIEQAELLAAVARQVDAGGRIVYAVCSTDPREGEGVVEPLIAAGRFVREALPSRYSPFATPAGDLLVPPGVDGRDGFYVAVLRAA